MHIPDGFLENAVSAPLIGAAAVSAGYSVSKLKKELFQKKIVAKKKLALAEGDTDSSVNEKWSLKARGREKIFAMATIGAFIFATQMMNFPVAEATSGHLIGAALATIVLGPFAGVLIISAVLILQALLFGDGGIIALGSNIINMAVVGSFVAYFVFDKLFRLPEKLSTKFFIGVFVAAWLSVLAASTVCSIELMLSGHGGIEVLTSMTLVHALIGIGEGIITMFIVALFFPKLLRS